MSDASCFFFLSPKNQGYTIKSFTSTQSKVDLANKHLVVDDSCIAWIGSENNYLLINDVLAHTINNKDSHMAKKLLHSTNTH